MEEAETAVREVWEEKLVVGEKDVAATATFQVEVEVRGTIVVIDIVAAEAALREV